MAMNDTVINATTVTDEQAQAGNQRAGRVEEKPTKAGKSETLATSNAVSTTRNAKRSMAATGGKAVIQGAGVSRQTKADVVLKKLRMARGVTIENLMEATGWQAHSVRGFLSAVVRKKLGLALVSDIGKDGVRRYRVDGTAG